MNTSPDTVVVNRVDGTEAANAFIDQLKARYGKLMFHQSGGCCDGSTPMCFAEGELLIGASDVMLGYVNGAPFYMSESQFAYWEHTHLTLDVVPGMGGQFSLDNGTGTRFHIRSRLYSDEELKLLQPVTRCT